MKLSIQAFKTSEVDVLAKLSKKTFLESHGHSAKPKDIQHYIDNHFSTEALAQALSDSQTHFRKILVDNQLAGYSKLILNQTQPLSELNPIAKFERLYLLKGFYGLQLGKELLSDAIDIAESHQQRGLWLFVWTENEKALKFYQKSNFKIIGQHDFKISEDHSNPNYVMLKPL